MKHLKTMAIVLLAVICLGTAALFIWKIADQAMEYKRGDDAYERMTEQAEGKGIRAKARTSPAPPDQRDLQTL
jgi:hypothetical protein